MQQIATTPFGRRPLSLAMMAAQAAAKACPDNAIGHKWKVFRNLTEAKDRFGLSDRALAVLSALLTFHPDVTLTPGIELVVFPSNRELSLRAHSPAPATLRRALSQLVEAGLVIRRDSPNGKRYVRRGEGGQVEQAFGFDLTPLVAQAAEFERLAEEVRADAKARMLLREEISLHRRDIAKTLEIALAEELSGPWPSMAERLRLCGPMPPRAASRAILEPLARELRQLRLDVDKCLAESTKAAEMSGSESQGETHHQNSKPEAHPESEPSFRRSWGGEAQIHSAPSVPPTGEGRGALKAYPLGMVLQACPDIIDYARHGILNWRDLMSAAALVRSILGISPSAWSDAVEAMGEDQASVLIAAILQKGSAVKSPGGYLRSLTERAREGQFSLGPVLMALIRGQTEERRKRAG